MKLGNFAREMGEQRIEEETQAAIDDARKALRGLGRDDCDECGRTIGEARRKAMPSAIRCFSCQESLEAECRRSAR